MLCIYATVSILDRTHMIRPHSTVLVFHMLQHGDLSPSFLWHRHVTWPRTARADGWRWRHVALLIPVSFCVLQTTSDAFKSHVSNIPLTITIINRILHMLGAMNIIQQCIPKPNNRVQCTHSISTALYFPIFKECLRVQTRLLFTLCTGSLCYSRERARPVSMVTAEFF